jgi:hypothetical protein
VEGKDEMSDVLTREVTPGSSVTLHGKEYKLTLPVRAVLLFKERTGVDLFALDKEGAAAGADSTENNVKLFHAMLCEHHPEVSFSEVTTLLDFGNFRKAQLAILECMASYLPRKEEEKKDGAELPNVEPAPVG